MKIKPFIQNPDKQFMSLHNALFDHLMPTVKPNSWKVLCFIVRRTIGWNKTSDRIAYSQFKEGTGIKKSETITAALAQLTDMGCITAYRSDKKKKETWLPTLYKLNFDFEIEIKTGQNGPPPTLTTPKNGPDPGPKNGPDSGPKNGLTKEHEIHGTQGANAPEKEELEEMFLTLTGLARPRRKKERAFWETRFNDMGHEFGPAAPHLMQAAVTRLREKDCIIASPASLVKTMRGLQAAGISRPQPQSILTPEEIAAYEALEVESQRAAQQATPSASLATQQKEKLKRVLS